MTRQQLGMLALALLRGLLYFTVLIGISQALVALNANLSPDIPWFPIPALGVIWIVTLWVKRRWDLRLAPPTGIAAGKVYAVALLATVAGMSVSVIEAAYHGLTRSAPLWPGEVSTAFQLTFLLVLPLIASVLAEVGYRGLIQTPFEKLVPLWPMLFFIAVINALFHFYDPDQASQWIRFISLNLAFGYVTWLSQSIIPALIAHIAMNIVEPVSEYLFGPVAMGELSPTTMVVITMLGLTALILAIVIARGVQKPIFNAT